MVREKPLSSRFVELAYLFPNQSNLILLTHFGVRSSQSFQHINIFIAVCTGVIIIFASGETSKVGWVIVGILVSTVLQVVIEAYKKRNRKRLRSRSRYMKSWPIVSRAACLILKSLGQIGTWEIKVGAE